MIHLTIVEVRQEAVQQALAAMQTRPKPSMPMPSKRTSVMAKSPDRECRDSGTYNNCHFCHLYYIFILKKCLNYY